MFIISEESCIVLVVNLHGIKVSVRFKNYFALRVFVLSGFHCTRLCCVKNMISGEQMNILGK